MIGAAVAPSPKHTTTTTCVVYQSVDRRTTTCCMCACVLAPVYSIFHVTVTLKHSRAPVYPSVARVDRMKKTRCSHFTPCDLGLLWPRGLGGRRNG